MFSRTHAHGNSKNEQDHETNEDMQTEERPEHEKQLARIKEVPMETHILIESQRIINNHNPVTFYKKWKKYNEMKLKQNGLK